MISSNGLVKRDWPVCFVTFGKNIFAANCKAEFKYYFVLFFGEAR